MAAEGNRSEDLSKPRSVLGDLTNQLGKRGFSESGKIGIQGFGLNDNNAKLKRARISPSQFTTIDSLKHKALSSKISSENRDPNLLDIGSGYRVSKSLDDVKTGSGDNHCLNEKNILSDSLKASIGEEHVSNIRGNSADLTIEANEESAESFHNDKNYGVDEAKVSLTPSDLNYENDSDDHYGDGFTMSQSGSIDCNFVPESQESRVFGVEKSSETNKGDVCANMSGFADSIKACSCSFYTKAAHIWLDLNYQDIKARVSATTRIQKEAIILSERIGKSKATERHGAESLTRVASLESNLRQHWRSLFQHMAGIWEKEGHQLEASLLLVSELREKLKTELELIATPMEKN